MNDVWKLRFYIVLLFIVTIILAPSMFYFGNLYLGTSLSGNDVINLTVFSGLLFVLSTIFRFL